MRRPADKAYRLGLGLATMMMAVQLAEKETDERRRARKQAVLTQKWAVLRTTFGEELAQLQGYGGTGPSLRQLVASFELATGSWSPAWQRALLIDVQMGDPFAPYELRVSMEDARHAIDTVAVPLGLGEAETELLWRVWNDAVTTYRSSRWRKPDHRVKHIPALATDELVLPPPHTDVPTVEAADAPANDHDTALLSGGSPSARDAGMAGAMWLVTTDRRAGPESSDRRLAALPLATARNELVKALMAHALIIEPGHADGITTSTLLAALQRIHAEVDALLHAERGRNEDDAQRVQTIEALLSAVDVTRDRVRESDAGSNAAPAAA